MGEWAGELQAHLGQDSKQRAELCGQEAIAAAPGHGAGWTTRIFNGTLCTNFPEIETIKRKVFPRLKEQRIQQEQSALHRLLLLRRVRAGMH